MMQAISGGYPELISANNGSSQYLFTSLQSIPSLRNNVNDTTKT